MSGNETVVLNNTKLWYQSKTVWGSFVAIFAGVLNGVTSIDLTEPLQAEIVDILLTGGGIVGGTIALIGRIKAVFQIVWKK